MNRIFCTALLLIVFLMCGNGVQAQQLLTLFEVVRKAKNESPAALRAATQKENRYWSYRTHLSNYKPQLVLRGNDQFSNDVIPVRQQDGGIEYQPVNQNEGGLRLNLEQQIGITGSSIFLSSSVSRFDDFRDGNTRYAGSPVFIEFMQPLFQFNPLRWNSKIEPLRYEESQKEYVEELESIAVRATSLFFDLLLAQASFEIAQKNLANNDTIYKIAEGRYNLGKVAEGELLQLELTLMRSQQQVAQARVDMETTALRLKSFIGLNDNEKITLIPPSTIPDFDVDVSVAIQEALNNRQAAIAFRRMELEAERDFARAKASTGIDANLVATFGLTDRGGSLPEVYRAPERQQTIGVNFAVPIIDWGRQKAIVKTAEANKELIEYTVAQERINFEEEVFTQVRLFEILPQQTTIAEKSNDIGQRRYELSKNRYLIGKISITDLNIAMQEKDEARRAYVAALRDFWVAYYRLRQMTLYDFEQDIPIIPD